MTHGLRFRFVGNGVYQFLFRIFRFEIRNLLKFFNMLFMLFAKFLLLFAHHFKLAIKIYFLLIILLHLLLGCLGLIVQIFFLLLCPVFGIYQFLITL